MSEMKKVAVVGAGSWGTAIANVFADAGSEVVIWGRDPEVVKSLDERKENPRYLRGLTLNPAVKASTDLAATLSWADVIVCSVPTQQIRAVFADHAGLTASKILVNTSKGMEVGSFALVSEIFRSVSPGSRYVVVSGPSFAEETVKRLPTAVTVASLDRESAAQVQRLLSTAYFRAYRSGDVIGVELAGALKNVIAISSGIVSGLGLGYNAQAATINRGIAEILRMGRHKGAEPMTFLGLAGMGDLILTCTGPLSRNFRLGVGLGQGRSVEEIQKDLGGVAEGYFTARSAYELSRKFGIEMPITEQVYRILYESSSPQAALTELMARDLKDEWEK